MATATIYVSRTTTVVQFDGFTAPAAHFRGDVREILRACRRGGVWTRSTGPTLSTVSVPVGWADIVAGLLIEQGHTVRERTRAVAA